MLAGLLSSVLLLALVHAQDLNNLPLSQTCKTALIAAVNNAQLSPCLNILGAIAVATTATNTSLITPLNNWVTGFCAANPCDPVLLNQASSNITTGCAPDIQSVGVNAAGVATLLKTIVGQYDTVRSVACLQKSADRQYCLTELLMNIEQGIGEPLSISTLLDLPNAIITGEINARTIPKSAYCTDCVEAVWVIAQQESPALASNAAFENALSNQCGMAFASASAIPAGIAEVTGSAALSGASKTASAALHPPTIPIGGLIATSLVMVVSIVAGVTLV